MYSNQHYCPAKVGVLDSPTSHLWFSTLDLWRLIRSVISSFYHSLSTLHLYHVPGLKRLYYRYSTNMEEPHQALSRVSKAVAYGYMYTVCICSEHVPVPRTLWSHLHNKTTIFWPAPGVDPYRPDMHIQEARHRHILATGALSPVIQAT